MSGGAGSLEKKQCPKFERIIDTEVSLIERLHLLRREVSEFRSQLIGAATKKSEEKEVPSPLCVADVILDHLKHMRETTEGCITDI